MLIDLNERHPNYFMWFPNFQSGQFSDLCLGATASITKTAIENVKTCYFTNANNFLQFWGY